jgi:hypothetical protein
VLKYGLSTGFSKKWRGEQCSKVKTDLTRDVGWEIVSQAGLRPVTQVSVNEVWSALRFRPVERVGK